MPRIVFKNIAQDQVRNLSKELAAPLSAAIGCPSDWITFEHLENMVFSMGEDITSQTIYIEVSWFKREQSIQDQVAAVVYETLRPLYPDNRDITVIFYELSKEGYYENGEHY